MNAPTLATLFEGIPWQAEGALFSEGDLKKTAGLAKAESPEATGALVHALLENARGRLLDIPVLDVLLGGWLRLKALQAYATEEMRASEETHEHELGRHEVSSKHEPKVELYVYDVKMADAVLTLKLTLVIAKAKLRIRKGVITDVALSGCEATATLEYGDHTLLEREAEELDFPLTLKLGKGIEIPPPLALRTSSGDSSP